MASMTNLTQFNSTSTWNGSAFTLSEAFTVPANTDWLLIRGAISTQLLDFSTVTLANSDTITWLPIAPDESSQAVFIGYVQNPTAGATTIDFTFGGVGRDIIMTVDAVNDVSAIGNEQRFGGYNETSRTLTTTTVANDLVVGVAEWVNVSGVGAGQTVDYAADTNGSTDMFVTFTSQTASSTSTDTVYTHNDGFGTALVVVLTDGAGGGANPSLNNAPATINMGTAFNVDHANFTNDIQSATVSDGTYTLSASSVTDNQDGTATITFPGLAHGQVIPEFGAGNTLTIDDQ